MSGGGLNQPSGGCTHALAIVTVILVTLVTHIPPPEVAAFSHAPLLAVPCACETHTTDRNEHMSLILPKKIHLSLSLALLLLLTSAVSSRGQGCILARSPEQSGLPTEQGGVLQPGHFQLSIGERHQFSYQHYVGDVYQEYREQDGTEVENRINLVTYALTYQVTPRVSVEVDAPWIFATRFKHGTPVHYHASGIGDTILTVNSWIRNPQHASRWNASLGLGIYMPTGNADVQNTSDTNTTGVGPAVQVTAPVDYSIQPGTGGWGGVLNWAVFSRIGHDLTFYTD